MALVERDRQLTYLTDLLTRCWSRGIGSVAVVDSPVGVGKTALLHALSERAASTSTRFICAAGSPGESRLPFGLISQLLHGLGPVDPHGLRATAVIEAMGRVPGEVEPRVLEGVSRAFHQMAAGQPLLIGIDDVHHADAESLQCLLFLARRVRQAPIMLVFTDQDRSASAHSPLRTELLRQPYCRSVRLDPLSGDGVAALLAHGLDAHVAHSLATAALAATGGNPLLLRALAEDWQASARAGGLPATTGLVVGDCFAERFVNSLCRCEPNARTLARTLAVLGDTAESARTIADLSGIDAVEVRTLVGLLGDAGLLRGRRFRHPAAQAAVLRDLPAAERAELHRAAARIIHAEGGPPTHVAHHLLAAGRTDEPWASAVLRESADNAATSGQVDFALDCLKLAHHMADDEQQRAVGRATLAEAEWKLDPARIVRHLGQLTEALHEGRLAGNHALATLAYLLWHGKGDQVALALDRLSDSAFRPAVVSPAELREVRACLELCYPALRRDADRDLRTAGSGSSSLVGALLQAARERFNGEDTSEYPWQSFRLGDPPLAPLSVMLLAMVRPERLATLAPWCLPLLDDAAAHGGKIWQALLAAVRADAALLQGDLATAAELAAAALEEITRPGWGVVVGAPIACLLTASVARGRYQEAAACLAAPMPGALLETPFGLRYLRARGQYQLAVGRPYAALSDFQTCGQLLRGWEADGPEAMPWRIDTAQALRRLNRHAEARTLLGEQLTRLGEHGDARTVGRALRHLAATEPDERTRRLTTAVECLQEAGDGLELAHALADLGAAYAEEGDSRRARTTLRRAWRVARECHAEELCKRLLPGLAGAPALRPGSGSPPGGGSSAELSAAEYRVGVLAAQGLANRQIADRLSITVSTVEQHLTQVYRKLKVRSRTDLPVYLQTDSSTLTDAHCAQPSF